jgi:hypothetical protein
MFRAVRPASLRQAQVEQDEVHRGARVAHPRHEFGPVADDERPVSGAFECGLEAVTDECGVVGDEHRFHGRDRSGGMACVIGGRDGTVRLAGDLIAGIGRTSL